MQLEISCPKCGKQSQIDFGKVPRGTLRTKCHGCGELFNIDKEAGINCRALRPEDDAALDFGFPDRGWKVEHPACAGMDYDIESINGLIRSGMVTAKTRVLPPGKRGYQPIETFELFNKALEQWEAKNARSGR